MFHWTFCYFLVVSNKHIFFPAIVQIKIPLKSDPISVLTSLVFQVTQGFWLFPAVKDLTHLYNPGCTHSFVISRWHTAFGSIINGLVFFLFVCFLTILYLLPLLRYKAELTWEDYEIISNFEICAIYNFEINIVSFWNIHSHFACTFLYFTFISFFISFRIYQKIFNLPCYFHEKKNGC